MLKSLSVHIKAQVENLEATMQSKWDSQQQDSEASQSETVDDVQIQYLNACYEMNKI